MNILQTEIQVEDEEGFLHVEMEEMIKIEMISHLQLEEISDWNCPPNQLDLQIGAVYHPHLPTFPHGMPGISTEPGENVSNQLNGPAAETTRSEGIDVGNVDRATMASQTEPMREDQETQVRPIISIDTGLQSNNIEPNEENVDIIPPAPISRA